MKNLKEMLKKGKIVVFDNENTFTDDFKSIECEHIKEHKNQLLIGFHIWFNGAYFHFKTFKSFERKAMQLKNDFNLELKITK